MASSRKRNTLRNIYDGFKARRLSHIKNKFKWKMREIEIKNEAHEKSHSLIWVWEFSKKAVLVCFIFYILVQIYSMTVMVVYYDFSHLGELIYQTGEIVRNCVFGYLVKAGIENVGKIFWSNKKQCPDDDDEFGESDEPVG